MAKKSVSFRVGTVQAYLRGCVWYLCYHDNGKRHRPRVGPDRDAARQLAAQVNSQLEIGAPAALSFEPIGIPEVRRRWLEHHEQVLRSSVQTVDRYRTATDHLLRFLESRPVRHVSQFHVGQAEDFVRYLRALRVSPNGHANTAKRPLLDAGLRYVLECCRALFNYAARRRAVSVTGHPGAADIPGLERELLRRFSERECAAARPLTRAERGRVARRLWRDMGAVREDRVRLEFMRLTRAIGLPACAAPKSLRHLFATSLQEGWVDPLIRNQLMGHVAAGARSAGHGLAMTAVYAHTRPETCRRQLEEALAGRPAVAAAQAWLRRGSPPAALNLRIFSVIIMREAAVSIMPPALHRQAAVGPRARGSDRRRAVVARVGQAPADGADEGPSLFTSAVRPSPTPTACSGVARFRRR